MRLPDGRLQRSRVVTDPRAALGDALDRKLTGYIVLEPQDTLLLDGEGRGIITFEDGVPVLATHTGTGRSGPPALADLAVPGPYHVDVYAVDPASLDDLHGDPEGRVPPGMPAERLAGDPALAASTRRAAPDHRVTGGAWPDDTARNVSTATGDRDAVAREPDERSAVEAFLDDEEKIRAIQKRARAEARERAEQWGFDLA